VKAPDYAAWVEQVGWYAKQQVNRSIEGAVVLVITFYLDDVYMQDIDNLVKGIMDGLQGILYKNDKAVTDLLTTKIDRPGHEGVAVLAWDVTNPPPGYWDFYKSMFLAYVPETKGVQ
jgi:Holliday junction resolvase RusA-like endonuclease